MPGETIRLIDDQGTIRDVPVEAAGSAIDSGWRVPTHEQEAGRVVEQAREESYGGVGGAVKAGVAGALRGVTVGGSDVLARVIGGEDAAIALEGLREANPGISTGTEVVGAAAPAFFTAGASTPASAVSAAGRGVARLAGGGLRGAVAGGVVEGGLYGLGSGVSELALSQDRLTAERAASALSSNMLFGGAVGGAAGGLAHGVERGIARAKGAIDTALERKAAKAKTTTDAIESGDLELFRDDSRALGKAREAEIKNIHQAQAPEREAFVSELRAAREADQAAKPWRYSQGHENPIVRGTGKEYLEADVKIRQLLKNERGLAENPARALDALQRQEQALNRLFESAEGEHEVWYRAWQNAPKTIRQEIVDASRGVKNAAWEAGERGPFTDAGLENAVEREMRRRYVDPLDPKIPGRLAPLLDGDLNNALERNAALQKRIVELSKPPESPRLAKIDDALEVLGRPKEPSVGGALMSAMMPFAGPVGVAAAAGNRVLGSFRKLADAATTRVGTVTSRLLGATGKAVAAAEPVVPVLATKTLGALAFGPAGRRKDDDEPKETLAALYKKRTDEIKGITAYDETGTPRLRPEARAKMADRLNGVRAAAPLLADKMETTAARRLEYLASLIPHRPDLGVLPTGPDRWQPSDLEMRSWARSAAAAEHPDDVEDRLIHGTLTPEDADAYKAVYPERYAALQQDVLARLPELQKSLPYKRRLALSIFTGVPVDPALNPAVLSVLQGQFVNDEGKPSTQAPTANPAFGSVKKSVPQPTPAQKTAAGDQL